MGFTNSNDHLTGVKPVPTPAGGEVVATRFSLTLATGDLALNDIGAVGILPAGCVPVGLLVDSDDLDAHGTPTLAMSVGVLNAAEDALSTAAADGGAVWGSGLTVAQAGGQVQVLSKALSRVSASQSDRKIGVLVSTAAATAAAGEIGLTLLYRAA
jgi:hypothetical protein